MALQIQGNGGSTVGSGAEAQRGLHVVGKPHDAGALGHYSYGGLTGILPAALAASSEIFQFRWADATRLALINKLTISAAVSTTFFAAGVPVQIDVIKSTAWTVAGTGGSTVSPAALLKKRTSFASTLVASGDIRIASTAALGVGTKTLEGLAMNTLLAAGPITASLDGTIIPPRTILWENDTSSGMHPLTLAQNEGFSIRAVAVPGTGTWSASFTVDWTEVTAY